MATYYWGGGSGTWSGTAVTNWYTDVGRTTLSTVAPTSADDVIFDSASSAAAYTVTISAAAVCRNWTAAGPATGNVTFAGSSAMSINGSVSWATTGITISSIGSMAFLAQSGTQNIDFGGVSLNNSTTWGPAAASTAIFTLLSNYTNSSSITVRSGTLDTNGFNIVFGTLTSATTTYVRSILLRTGSHMIGQGAQGAVVNLSSTNLTFDAGTSTVSSPSNNSNFSLIGAFTFYNVTITGQSFSLSYNANLTISNVLNLGDAANSTITLNSGFTLTVGTIQWWNTARTSRSSRKTVNTSTSNAATISATNFVNFENVDFLSIIAAGTAPWTTGTSIGNIGSNTGITFDASKTVYWNNAAGGSWQSNSWATELGGAVADVNYPLPQDTVIIGDTGLNSGASITVSIVGSQQVLYSGSIDSSSRTLPWSFTSTVTANIMLTGDFKASSGTITSNNLQLFLMGSGTLSSAGSTLLFPIVIESRTSGTYTLGSNIVLPVSTFNVNTGNLSMGTFSITTITLILNSSNPCGISTTGGVFNVSGNAATVVNLISPSATITGTLNINLTYSGASGTRTLVTSAANTSIRTINYNITAGTDIVLLGLPAFYGNNIDFTGFSGTLNLNTSVQIYGDNITFSPTMATSATTNTLNWNNALGVSARTFDTKGVTFNFPINFTGTGTGTPVWNLASNIVSNQGLVLTYGTFNTNNYNITALQFSFNNANTKTINLGSSIITLNVTNSSTPWSAATAGTTFNAGTSSIIINQNATTLTSTFSGTLTGAGLTYNKVYFNGNTSGIFVLNGSGNTINYFENISTKPVTIRLLTGVTNTFGTLKLNGVRGRRVAVQSTTTTAATIAKSGGGVSENDYLDLSYVNASAANTFYAGRYSTTVAGTSTNWVFNFFTKPKIGNALGFFH
jgi:hypothetical protein